MVVGSPIHRAFAVWFRDLERWDPASVHGIEWHWAHQFMQPIGSILKSKKEKVDKKCTKFSELQPITIHFDGSIDKRKVDANREYTMDLWYARPGDIVVAKIDLKNGAVGIVPTGWQNVVVTGHFAVYQPDRTRLVPGYLHLLIQTSFFKAHLWRNKVGAEGRKEVKLNFFESEKIPLPPLPIQQAIVDRWEQAQKEIAAGQERILCKERETAERFIRELRLTLPKPASREKGFAVLWKDFARWSVSYNHTASSLPDLTKGKYPVVSLGAILEMVQYGTSEKANQAENGTPILRINNIKDGRIDTADLKHIPIQEKQKDALRLEDGDILIIRTSGSRNLVGTCAAFHEEGDFCFASYLIRLRVRETRAIPDFVAHFINSPLGRQQVDSLSRKIMQNNINSEEIRSLQIPLPPLPVQKEILRQIVEGRAEVSKIRGAVQEIASDSKREIETLILGTKKVDGREPTRLTS
jgi:type I restriction enzyme S subunit